MESIDVTKPIDFKLQGINNKYYTLDDFQDKKYLAIMFSCNHCPYVVASEREFVELQQEFGRHGFQLVAINPNSPNKNYPADSFENMKKRAAEKGFNFPYLVDETQEVARSYGAGRTPEIFLYDENRDLVYHGRINDDPKHLEEISRHDLKIALQELIDGKKVSMPYNNPIGCSIKYLEE